MPVEANNNSVKNYNMNRIKWFCVDTDNYLMMVHYGLCCKIGDTYEYKTMNKITVEGQDLADMYLTLPNPDLSVRDNIKERLYQYLIDKGLIDNNIII